LAVPKMPSTVLLLTVALSEVEGKSAGNRLWNAETRKVMKGRKVVIKAFRDS
jgi:hypothetical protein